MLSNKVGSFGLNTGTGNQAITGLGFQPKLVMLLNNPQISNSVAPAQEMHLSLGAYDGTGQFLVYQSARYGTVTNATNKIGSDIQGITASSPSGSATPLYKASFVSLDADGFTVNVGTAGASAYRVGYWALGGTDIQNVKIGNFQAVTSPGNQIITGLGFQPDIILIVGVRLTLQDSNSAPAHFNMGVAVRSPLTQYGLGNYSRSGVTTSSTRKNQNNTYIYELIDFTGGIAYGSVSSFDADGFTMNWATAPSSAVYLYYIAIKTVATIKLGYVQMNGIGGAQPVTGLGIAPDTGLFFGTGQQTFNSGTVVSDNEMSLAVVDNSLNKFNISHVDLSALGSSRNYNYQHDAHIFTNINTGPTIGEQADLITMDADGFTLNVETAAGTPSYLLYLLLGGTGVPVTTDDDGFIS